MEKPFDCQKIFYPELRCFISVMKFVKNSVIVMCLLLFSYGFYLNTTYTDRQESTTVPIFLMILAGVLSLVLVIYRRIYEKDYKHQIKVRKSFNVTLYLAGAAVVCAALGYSSLSVMSLILINLAIVLAVCSAVALAITMLK